MTRRNLLSLVLLALVALSLGWAARDDSGERPLRVVTRNGAVSPAPLGKQLIVCLPSEPPDLFWTQEDASARIVLDALREPLIESRGYEYQANLVEKLPSFADGDAALREVLVGQGNRFFDALSQQPMVLTATMAGPFGLYQLDGSVQRIEQWDGQPLRTVQVSAHWRLVEGLRWQDGTPVTAKDSLFAFELTLDPTWRGDRYLTERTTSYREVDSRTVEWLSLPGYTDSTYFLNLWAPVPRHLYEALQPRQIVAGWGTHRRPFSYGPYLFEEWVRGEYISLAANPHYVRGPVPIQRVTFRWVPDPDELMARLLSGECDVGTPSPALGGVRERLQASVHSGRLGMQEVPGAVFEHLDFNLAPAEGYTGAAATLLDNVGGSLFRNVAFRRAVAACVNRERLVAQSSNGAAFPRTTYLSAQHLLYPGDAALALYPFNPMPARDQLAGLGWRDTDGDGVLDDGAGLRLSLSLAVRRSDQRADVAFALQAQLRQYCGIELHIELLDSDFFTSGPEGAVFGRQYDLALFGWLSAVEPPCYLYLSSEIPAAANGWHGANVTGFADPAFDQACNTALRALDEDVKAQQHGVALALFTQQLPSLPLFARAETLIYRPEILGLDLDPTAASPLWNIEQLHIEQ